MDKYHKDAPFQDPVLRCDSCSQIVQAKTLAELGRCKCGNRKIRNLQTFTPEEKEQMEAWGVDPDFLAQFEGVDVD